MNIQSEKKIISDREFKLKSGLSRYLPEEVLEFIAKRFAAMPVYLKITKNRKTKLGDYRAAHLGKPHTITINHDLNKYSFLITLVHEMAHYECWQLHKNKVKPHGLEWKNEFKKIMGQVLMMDFMPADIAGVLVNYMDNPLASSCTDVNLMRALKKHDQSNTATYLEDIPENTYFMINNKHVFQKGEKRRKLYKCKEMHTKKTYLVNPLCEVKIVDFASIGQ